jgi:hypothetical protein
MIIRYWYFENREVAMGVEREVLKVFRNRFPKTHLTKEDMPQHGYTEAFSSDAISSRKVINIINKIIKNKMI